MYYSVHCAVDEFGPGLPEEPTNPRDSRTRSDGPYASRSLVKSETLRDISESTAFSRLPFIWLCPPAVQKPTLDSTSRGRFPKEFAINASTPHCASICFRLSTRGRRSHSVVVETNIRAPRVVCDFLRSCVFPRKWRRIDRTYRDPSRNRVWCNVSFFEDFS